MVGKSLKKLLLSKQIIKLDYNIQMGTNMFVSVNLTRLQFAQRNTQNYRIANGVHPSTSDNK